MMIAANEHLAEQMSELRWLVYELGQEVETLSTTPYPHVHRLLAHSLAAKVAQVAEATGLEIQDDNSSSNGAVPWSALSPNIPLSSKPWEEQERVS